jgi:hypothetical protein
MFDSETGTTSFSAPLFVAQLFGAPFMCFLLGSLVGAVWEALGLKTGSGHPAGELLQYTSFAAVGFALGYAAQATMPRCVASGGRWVWLIPATLLSFGILQQVYWNPSKVVGTYFFSASGIEPIALALLTWPTVATCFYSCGIALADRLGPAHQKT